MEINVMIENYKVSHRKFQCVIHGITLFLTASMSEYFATFGNKMEK